MLSFYHGQNREQFVFSKWANNSPILREKLGKCREKYIFPRNLLTIFPSASSALVNIGFLVEDYERIHNYSKVSKRDGF